MKTAQSPTIPVAPADYEQTNEQTTRRSIEQYMSDLRDDVASNQTKSGKDSSLALRRFQFLLMGA